ncbi:MAG TPA: hypothetical protein VG347_05750 [Verrucomicrobiae bacterium]|nr:hypothetical protein [Verrucomicrobiae bacterium]
MKLNHLVSPRINGRVIQQFGAARLVKHRNGQHELIGGSTADRAEAFEWVTLFAHEIVFSHFHRQPSPNCRTRKKLLSRIF